MYAATCNVALHVKGLIITLNITHTVYTHNLRHNVTIITITVGFIFQNLCVDNVKPSLQRGPDGLRGLFDSPSVRIDTTQIACAFVSEPGTFSTEKITKCYLQYSQTVICRRGSLGGKTAVACPGSFAGTKYPKPC